MDDDPFCVEDVLQKYAAMVYRIAYAQTRKSTTTAVPAFRLFHPRPRRPVRKTLFMC